MRVKFSKLIDNKWSKKVKIRWIVVSILLIMIGAALSFYIKPKLVEFVIKFLLVATPKSYVRMRQEQKLRFVHKLFLWNITNPKEIMAGMQKPKLQEIGPYVFE